MVTADPYVTLFQNVILKFDDCQILWMGKINNSADLKIGFLFLAFSVFKAVIL
jgi:hypothetical protein